jgi:hypothetical protein
MQLTQQKSIGYNCVYSSYHLSLDNYYTQFYHFSYTNVHWITPNIKGFFLILNRLNQFVHLTTFVHTVKAALLDKIFDAIHGNVSFSTVCTRSWNWSLCLASESNQFYFLILISHLIAEVRREQITVLYRVQTFNSVLHISVILRMFLTLYIYIYYSN